MKDDWGEEVCCASCNYYELEIGKNGIRQVCKYGRLEHLITDPFHTCCDKHSWLDDGLNEPGEVESVTKREAR